MKLTIQPVSTKLQALIVASGAALAAGVVAVTSCLPHSGGGNPGQFQPPPGFDLSCRTTGDGYPWEGATHLETGLSDVDVTVFDTGRAEVDLAEGAGLVWDSFLAQNPQGGFADGLYGRGAYLREDVRLTKSGATDAILNDGGTLVKYTLVDKNVYAPVTEDGTRLKFNDDGTAQIKVGPQLYETFAKTSVPPVSGSDPVLVIAELCSEPDCSGAHTTIVTDDSGRIKTVTDKLGYSKSYGYDGNGRLQSVTFADRRTQTFGYDDNGNLATVSYPALMKGAPQPTRTYVYDGWKLTTAQGPGNGTTMPKATFAFADDGQLQSLEPIDHDTTTIAYQADTPKSGYTTVTLTDRTHIAGKSAIVMVDDPCALAQVVDSMKYTVNLGRDGKHQLTSVSDPDNPMKNETQLEDPMNGRDSWGDVRGTIDDELGEKFELSPTDEDGREGRPASSFSGPDGSGTILYAKDDPNVNDLPAWAVDLPSDETWTTNADDDSGKMNTVTLGARHTYKNTGDSSCPRQIVDTDKLSGMTETTCMSADGAKLLSVTDGFGLKTSYDQTDDPTMGETLVLTPPSGEKETVKMDPAGRLLQTSTAGFNDEEDDAYYDNGMLQARHIPGANTAAGGGTPGFQEDDAIDPETLLETDESDEDGDNPVDDESYAYYPEGVLRETDLNYSNGGNVPVGQQSFSCPWWASGNACQ
jgi:YD repeat-containing protein